MTNQLQYHAGLHARAKSEMVSQTRSVSSNNFARWRNAHLFLQPCTSSGSSALRTPCSCVRCAAWTSCYCVIVLAFYWTPILPRFLTAPTVPQLRASRPEPGAGSIFLASEDLPDTAGELPEPPEFFPNPLASLVSRHKDINGYSDASPLV